MNSIANYVSSDTEKFSWIKDNLYVAVVSDILDILGYRNNVMHQRLRPLDPDNCIIVGRARTLRWMETDYVELRGSCMYKCSMG